MTSSLWQAWRRTVRSDPSAPALIDAAHGWVLSRSELDDIGSAWASAAGPSLAGRTVLFAEPNGADWMAAFLGLLRLGAVMAAADPGEPPAALQVLARAAGASFLWREGRLQPLGRGRRPPRGARLFKLTSGSTGLPRALAFTDEQMLADGRQICATMEIRGADLNLALIPFGHSYGLGNLVVPLLARGTAALVGASPLPQALAETIERWKPTVFPSVPAVLRALAESDIDPRRLRPLRTVISAGAPLPAELARRFQERFGRRIHNFYGSSETGGIAYDRTGDAGLEGSGAGLPLRGVRILFGRGGRFTVQSPAVFTLGNPRARGGRGVHQPADLGRRGPRGEIQLLGRSGRLLKLAGRRLDPAEVERALRALPGVRDAFVGPHPGRPESLAAVVAGEAEPAALRAALAGSIAGWKIPRRILVRPELPLTPRGKPDLRRLRGWLG